MWFLLKISVRSRRKVSDVVQNIVGEMAELRFHRLYPYEGQIVISQFSEALFQLNWKDHCTGLSIAVLGKNMTSVVFFYFPHFYQ